MNARRLVWGWLLATGAMSPAAMSAQAPSGAQPQRPQPARSGTSANAFTGAAKALDALTASGADRSVLAGIATTKEIDQVRAAARAVVEAARQGDQSAPQSLMAGRALVLLAAEAQAGEREDIAKRAVSVLAQARLPTTAAEGLRRLSLAEALWLSGGLGIAQTEDGDTAASLLEGVLDLPVGEDPMRTLPRGLRAEAMGLAVMLADAAQREKAISALKNAVFGGELAVQKRADPAMELFLAEVQTRWALEAARGSGPLNAESLTRAVERLDELVARTGSIPSDQFDPPAVVKLAAALERAGVSAGSLPPKLQVAWARSVLAHAPSDGAARKVLNSLTGSTDAELAAAALWWIGAAMDRADESGASWATWAELHKRLGATRSGVEALERGAKSYARHRQIAGDRHADPAVYLPLLEALLASNPDDARAARWRVDLSEAIGNTDAARAFRLLDEAASSPRAGETAALADQRGTTMVAKITAGACDKAARTGSEALLKPESVEAALAWAVRRRPNLVPELRLALACVKGAQKDSEDAALQSLLGLINDRANVGIELRTRAALQAAQLYRATDRPADAFAILRRLADELDRAPAAQGPAAPGAAPSGTAPPAPVRRDEFWQLWAEMLAVMVDENKTGERSGDIRLRIRQLETIDPKMGGGEWAKRIRAIEQALKERL